MRKKLKVDKILATMRLNKDKVALLINNAQVEKLVNSYA